jgi:mRNA-degrading endonuclease RelE of RelBE toxin-antitoxin system
LTRLYHDERSGVTSPRSQLTPLDSTQNVTALSGAKDAFRLRHGDWRALYWINRETQTMVVEAIVPRGGAYR